MIKFRTIIKRTSQGSFLELLSHLKIVLIDRSNRVNCVNSSNNAMGLVAFFILVTYPLVGMIPSEISYFLIWLSTFNHHNAQFRTCTIFSRESDSTITNVRLLVCPSVSKTLQQLEIIILHHPSHSSFILPSFRDF